MCLLCKQDSDADALEDAGLQATPAVSAQAGHEEDNPLQVTEMLRQGTCL